MVKERHKRLLHVLGDQYIKIPVKVDRLRWDEFFKPPVGHELDGLEGRMQGNGHIQLLGLCPDRIIVWMPVRFLRPGKRREKSAFATRLDRPLQFCRRFIGIRAGQMGDRDEAATRLGAEVHNPAVIGPAIGGRYFRVLDLTLP